MSINKTNIYFTAQASQSANGYVIDFRHASTGLVLDMTEALQITGLPSELTLRNHPHLPGRAAWAWSGGTILQLSLMLRRAGFASSRNELANPRPVPPKPEPKEPKAGDGPFRVLAPGIVMDMSGIMPRGTPREPYKAENVFFAHKELKGRTYVSFGEKHPEYPNDPAYDIDSDIIQDPLWDDLRKIVDREGQRFVSKYNADETKKRLEALGLSYDKDIILWIDPKDLRFGVSTELYDDYTSEGHTIFIIPSDEDSPAFDDLRDEHLAEVPPYFADNLMENTWLLTPETTREAAIADMVARGYVYDSDLDNELGG